MCLRLVQVGILISGLGIVCPSLADDPDTWQQTVHTAISRAIPPLEKGAAGSADERTCFTCHNQALPVLALVAAHDRGFTVDAEKLQRQVQHASEHLKRGHQNYLDGKGQGGRVLTAGYALWTLEAADWPADEDTAAVSHFLLDYQRQGDHWSHPGSRPPSSGSDFTATYVALRSLAAFAPAEQQSQVDARKQTVHKWLLSEQPKDTEDRVFQLRALPYVDAEADIICRAAADLVNDQRSDGGWSQLPEMESDAYATGTVLAAMLETRVRSADDAAIRRGLLYLLDTQQDDGTWHVASRAKPFQTYYESGFPHGKDQFISIAASSWATLALTMALPEKL